MRKIKGLRWYMIALVTLGTEFISQEISNQFWHTIMFRRLFFLATTTAGRAVPHLLHDLVNFIADIQQLHATRGRRFGHQSIQLIAEIH